MAPFLTALGGALEVFAETVGPTIAEGAISYAVNQGAGALHDLSRDFAARVRNGEYIPKPQLTSAEAEKVNKALLELRKAAVRALKEDDREDFNPIMKESMDDMADVIEALSSTASNKTGFYDAVLDVLKEAREIQAEANADFIIPGQPLFDGPFTEKVLRAKSLCSFLDRIERSTGLNLQALMDLQTFLFSTEPRDVRSLVGLGLCGGRTLTLDTDAVDVSKALRNLWGNR